jgi:hypothetical protein
MKALDNVFNITFLSKTPLSCPKMFWGSVFMFEHFNYTTYRSILETLRSKADNLCFETFLQTDIPARFFILRHDIDFSPKSALQMAELEAKWGFRATYFLLFSSPYYNLLSEEHITFPRRLAEMSHEVGLHYDVKAYAAIRGGKMHETLHTEIQLLSELSGHPVRSIAMHNPSVYGEDPFRDIETFINAYDDRFTKEIAYFSDSGGAWRNEPVDRFGKGDIPPRLQLLIHPLFWGERTADRWERLTFFTRNRFKQIEEEAQRVKEIWASHPGVYEHDRRNLIHSQ